MRDAYYFPHDSIAFNDSKIIKMVMELGLESYAIYWVIIENLRNEEGYSLHKDSFATIAYQCRCDEAKVEQIVSKYNLFTLEDSGYFYSISLLKRMEKLDDIKEKKQESGRLGGLASSKARAKSKQRLSDAQLLDKNRVDNKKEDNITSPIFDLETPINYLNEEAGRSFDITRDCHLKLILARYKEGRKLEDFKIVINKKVKEWTGDKKMCKFLRPSTLFNATNFENYMNEKEAEQTDVERWGNL